MKLDHLSDHGGSEEWRSRLCEALGKLLASHDALRELVGIQDLKKTLAIEHHRAANSLADADYATASRLSTELARRTPLAWDMARRILAEHAAAQPEASGRGDKCLGLIAKAD